ncbi:MAG TPA: ATP-binding protein, partial [Candidatus Obscuribacter sp.]|nr:ATP-binding protein [Candidatus Obscuribacter sp.]
SVSINALIAEAVEQVRAHAEKKGVELSLKLADGEVPDSAEGAAAAEPKIVGNYLQLLRAITNILTNAVNYTPEGGAVSVTSRLIEGKVSVRIQDTGVGIEPADLPHIFERFYRADKARTRETGGTGLGLAITREIIARHHGTVDVESTVGKGSSFTIQLPLR